MFLLAVITDLLQKSLKVLSISNVLMQKLTQLQHIEVLQRKGAVLQDMDAQKEVNLSFHFFNASGFDQVFLALVNLVFSQCSQYSQRMVFRLEELVEELQDRRRKADEAAMLFIQQQQESKVTESQVRSSFI